MLSRRSFIITGITAAAALTIAGKSMGREIKSVRKMKNGKIKKGLVVWYSQTGNTERIGRVIAATWKKQGMEVLSGDYREIDPDSIADSDIIAAGSPVYYYEVPENFSTWLKSIPDISGTPVASYVTFGGEGGNQLNTACELMELLVGRGGVPAGSRTFSNMATFPPTWSSGNSSRVLKYSSLPDKNTFSDASDFARKTLIQADAGEAVTVKGNFSLRNCIRGGTSIAFTKLLISGHRINSEKCISCGRCTGSCPVNAISYDRRNVNTGRCIACFGCVNNCPVNAVEMKFSGKEVYGYREFVKRNNITVHEPDV